MSIGVYFVDCWLALSQYGTFKAEASYTPKRLMPISGARKGTISVRLLLKKMPCFSTNLLMSFILSLLQPVQRKGPMRIYSYDDDSMRCHLAIHFELREGSQVLALSPPHQRPTYVKKSLAPTLHRLLRRRRERVYLLKGPGL